MIKRWIATIVMALMLQGCTVGHHVVKPSSTCAALATKLMGRHQVTIDREGIRSIKDNGDLLLRMKELMIEVDTANKMIAFDKELLQELCQ